MSADRMGADRVESIRFEHHRQPIGIGESRPRISWATRTSDPGWWQAAYEVEIRPEGGAAWTSGRIDSDESVLVAWGAPPLASRERRSVRVRVWGRDRPGPSPWSEPEPVEAGLLDPADWTARFVRPVLPRDLDEPVMLLRHEFRLESPVARARLYATAHGVYTATLNGRRTGDHVLAPGWSGYRHRLRYQTYDVTELLLTGDNAIGVALADGWFRGPLGFTGTRAHYGGRTGALLQLEVEHTDGTRTRVTTDETWRASLSATTRAGLYGGETCDLRAVRPGWAQPGFREPWAAVEMADLDPAVLVAPDGPPVRRTRTLAPVGVTVSPSGRTILDFGQNLVGRLRVRVPSAPAGTEITFRHAEVLEHGELGTRPLRGASATDTLVLDGSPAEWEPEFTFHGFRYAEVTGWPGQLDPAVIEAVVIHTDLRATGSFTCSDPEVNRLHENVLWGMRGNFVDVPTDCPQRDERLGWTGDLQVFAPTAAFLYDVAGMLRSWLTDLRIEQLEDGDGIVPNFVPTLDLMPVPPDAEAGWGDAAVVVPWVLYQRYGDPRILADQWPSMSAWIRVFADRAGPDADFPGGGFSFGDWLDPSAPPDSPAAARTPWPCVATAYLARSAAIVAETASLLGHDPDPFRALAERAAARFRAEYVAPNGRVAFPSQTAYALALQFDLLEPAQREHAGALLADQVASDGFRIGTGFLGTPLISDALTETGHVAAAYELLLQREHPSWLYPVTMGATTIWERWDSMLPDGTINPGTMTSFNHYAYGAIADWLHRVVAGLAPAEPGYRRIAIAPRLGHGILSASASHETPYGPARVSWRLDGTDFGIEVVVPPNSSAEVRLPDGSEPIPVGSGTHRFAASVTPPEPAPKPALFWTPDD